VPRTPSVRYAVVRFKQETFTFIAPFRIAPGETVVVEGDRGENIGVVVEITQVVPGFEVTSRILRIATDKDMAALAAQRERELAVKKSVQSLSASIGLHATIEDVEYQFDLNKLTIFVRRSAKGGFVDFRKLQRSLFREFRCRIWCAYMDEVEAVENGPRTR
jgi:cell fate regulator YaaT (PSP1 superfamily)